MSRVTDTHVVCKKTLQLFQVLLHITEYFPHWQLLLHSSTLGQLGKDGGMVTGPHWHKPATGDWIVVQQLLVYTGGEAIHK